MVGSEDEGNDMTEYLVQGMTCAHCVASVTEEVSAVPGVAGVDVQLVVGGSSVVTVRPADPGSPVADDAVEAAVEEAGYRVVQS